MPARFQFSLRAFCFTVLGICLFAGLVLRPMILSAITSAEFNSRISHMRWIGLSLAQYEAIHKCYPPCSITGPDGRPWHSWRVLVAAQQEPEFMRDYRFNEPWDSEHNSRYITKPPSWMASDSGDTPFLMITGQGFAGLPNVARTTNEILDGDHSTICVIDFPESTIKWTEPRDMDNSPRMPNRCSP